MTHESVEVRLAGGSATAVSAEAIRLLMIEDNAADVRLIVHTLRQAGFSPEWKRVDNEADLLANLDAQLDAILCDYRMPELDAMNAFELARARCPDVPFLIVSGSIGEESAVQVIKMGVTDYLMKDRLGRLGVALRQAMDQRRLQQAQRQAQAALHASEAQYRALAESIPQLVWMVRSDGHLEYVNRRVLEYTGLTYEQCVETNGMSPIHPDDIQSLLELRAKVFQTQETSEVAYRIRRFDGQYRWHITRAVALRDADNQITKWLGTCTDIHDQKESADRTARDALLLASVRDSVIVTDLAGVVTYWNEGATRLFGWTAEEMLGRRYADRFPENMRAKIAAQLKDRVAGSDWNREFQDYRKDGSRVWVHERVARISDAQGHPVGFLGVAYDITSRRQAEDALRLRDRAIQAVSQGILITDPNQPDNPVIYASPSLERLTGYSPAELLGHNCQFLQGKDTDPAAVASLRTAVRERQACAVEILNYRKDGTPFWNALSIAPVYDGARLTHWVGVLTDVTERRRLEAQYRQGQKMEAFGQLAGGVAHDFNNLLTIINGFAQLLILELPQSDPRMDALAAIREAGQRAAGLTAQLLAFSRKTIVEPKILDVNEVVENLSKMLRRLLGEDILFATVLDPQLHRVKVDRSQLDQVIMNLSINARDAMPTGGRLTLETMNVELSAKDCAPGGDYKPGQYVRLRVSDTGCGMTPSVQAKIFEPFFTTKEVGKGSGLGLATVYGIVKTYHGHVEVWSEVDRGTTISVFLPVVPETRASLSANSPLLPHRGNETVLLVEDEAVLRRLMRISLETCGYKVLEAKDSLDAVRIAGSHPGRIHLLVTDVVMPGIAGREVARQVQAHIPQIRVLYVSGYTDDTIVRHGVSQATDAFLQKPFTLESLTQKVRRLLDAGC